MGLSESAVSVNKEGVVVGSGIVGNRKACGMCKLVGASNNEIFKGIFKIVVGKIGFFKIGFFVFFGVGLR